MSGLGHIGLGRPWRIGRGASAQPAGRELPEILAPWTPPLRRREFWAVQALVAIIAGGHGLIEVAHVIPDDGPMYLVPVSLFYIPVVYAAVNFGLSGAAPTAIWCAVITIPNVLLWHHGLEQFGELWQIGTVVVIGFFVGNRADREIRARHEAEGRARAHRAAEEKYRNLFDHVAEPILLLDPEGRVQDANSAAERLLGSNGAPLAGRSVSQLVGPRLAEMLVGRAAAGVDRLVADGDPRWVEPIITFLRDPSGNPRIQVVLRDVTRRYERQRELEDYTRRTLSGREEERRRIARDLHDGPVQSLVLLVRKLDRVTPFASPGGAEALGEARTMAEEVAAELRRFSRELRPSILDDLGLGPAIEAEAKAFRDRAGLEVQVGASSGLRRLAPDVELALLRIEQEALHNVERHAGASRVRVRLSQHNGSARLTVEDDGRGIGRLPAPTALLGEGKMGIVGMQERARAVDGRLRIGRSRLGGTFVEATVPSRGVPGRTAPATTPYDPVGTAPSPRA